MPSEWVGTNLHTFTQNYDSHSTVHSMNRSAALVWLFVGLVVVAIGTYWLFGQSAEPGNSNENGTQNGITTDMLPEVISVDRYNLTLRFPSSWRTATSSLPGDIPAVNTYVPEIGTSPPYTHHDNVTNVSVFPNGIPTEGLFAKWHELDFDPGFAATSSRVFTLEDGTPFAAFIRPLNPPGSWGQAGFIWMRVRVNNLATRCFDATSTLIPDERCNPLASGHEVRWSGTVDTSRWQEAQQILRSITFNP